MHQSANFYSFDQKCCNFRSIIDWQIMTENIKIAICYNNFIIKPCTCSLTWCVPSHFESASYCSRYETWLNISICIITFYMNTNIS